MSCLEFFTYPHPSIRWWEKLKNVALYKQLFTTKKIAAIHVLAILIINKIKVGWNFLFSHPDKIMTIKYKQVTTETKGSQK